MLQGSAGDSIIAGESVDIKPGNAMPLGNMPVGTIVHNVELKIGKGGQLARSAGTYVQIVGRDREYCILRLKSGEQRLVHGRCLATVGAVSNPDHMNISIGKAGRNRWKGRMPSDRGVAMNPVDHPHGGGEGRTGRPPSGYALGLPDQGQEDPQEQAHQTLDRLEPSRRKKKRKESHGPLGLERPVRRRLSVEEGREPRARPAARDDQDLERAARRSCRSSSA